MSRQRHQESDTRERPAAEAAAKLERAVRVVMALRVTSGFESVKCFDPPPRGRGPAKPVEGLARSSEQPLRQRFALPPPRSGEDFGCLTRMPETEMQ